MDKTKIKNIISHYFNNHCSYNDINNVLSIIIKKEAQGFKEIEQSLWDISVTPIYHDELVNYYNSFKNDEEIKWVKTPKNINILPSKLFKDISFEGCKSCVIPFDNHNNVIHSLLKTIKLDKINDISKGFFTFDDYLIALNLYSQDITDKKTIFNIMTDTYMVDIIENITGDIRYNSNDKKTFMYLNMISQTVACLNADCFNLDIKIDSFSSMTNDKQKIEKHLENFNVFLLENFNFDYSLGFSQIIKEKIESVSFNIIKFYLKEFNPLDVNDMVYRANFSWSGSVINEYFFDNDKEVELSNVQSEVMDNLFAISSKVNVPVELLSDNFNETEKRQFMKYAISWHEKNKIENDTILSSDRKKKRIVL